ncbi:MAG: DUF2461 domain-containing protein [Pirellula sp.]
MSKSSSTHKSPFSPRLFTFLRELKANNDREWFAENKTRYEADVFAPALEFVTQMKPHVAKLSRYLLAEPKRVGGSIMRVYRDTRFAKDKTPYKTNVGIHFRHSIGGDVHAPGLYVHLEPDACFLAAGIWMPPADALQAIRTAIVEHPADWKKASANKSFLSRYKLDGESLKTAPRGIDPSHPAIADLRRKSFAGVTPISDKEFLQPDALERIAIAFADAKPLMKFLCDALQQPY